MWWPEKYKVVSLSAHMGLHLSGNDLMGCTAGISTQCHPCPTTPKPLLCTAIALRAVTHVHFKLALDTKHEVISSKLWHGLPILHSTETTPCVNALHLIQLPCSVVISAVPAWHLCH